MSSEHMEIYRIIAVIPARSGSKRLKDKNKKAFCGKPLINWTIDLALQMEFFNKVIVTTDDQGILNMCKVIWNYRNVQVVERPKSLAQNDTEIWEVINHLFIKGHIPDKCIIVLLQPTSPLRNASDIHKAVLMFLRTKEGVIPITKIDNMNYKRCGTVFVDWYNLVHNYQGFREGQFILIPPERAIDIDTLEDFQKAEKIMEKRIRL